MRKATLPGIVVALGVCLTLFTWTGPAGAADTVRIGILSSSSGYQQPRGVEQKEALVAMVEDLNSKGGALGKQVELVFADDKSAPEAAAAAVEKLAREEKVSAIVGSFSPALLPVIDREKIPFVVTSPVQAPFNKWVFPVGPGDRKLAAHAVELAISTFDAKRVAFLYEANEVGPNVLKIISGEIGQYPGVSLVAKENFGVNETNMTAQLSRIKAANPDVVVLLSSGEATTIAIAQNCKEMGMKTPFVCLRAFGSPNFMKVAGPTVEELKWNFTLFRVMVAESLPPTDTYRKVVYAPAKKIMDDKYGAGRMITGSMAITMDGLNMVVLALKAAGSDDRAVLRDAMEKVKFQGLMGGVAPAPDDHQGGAKDTSALSTLKGGRFVPNVK